MVSLRNACIRLTNRYWLAQGLTLLLLGCPALAMRFENVRLGLLLGTCALAVLAINTWIAHIDARELVEGFADHLELPFDRGSQEVVCLVVGEAFAGRKARDALGGLLRVPQEFAGISVHRRCGFRWRCARGNRGWRGCCR